WSLGIGDDAISVTDYKIAGALANVYTMVTVRGMTDDSFVFFVESIHGRPGKGYSSLQVAPVVRQADMLPRSSRCVLLTRSNDIPGRKSEFVVLSGVVGTF